MVTSWALAALEFFELAELKLGGSFSAFSSSLAAKDLPKNYVMVFGHFIHFIFTMIQTAIVRDDPTLLISRFSDQCDQLFKGPTESPSKIEFALLLQLLGYQCPSCSKLGCCALVCTTAKCKRVPGKESKGSTAEAASAKETKWNTAKAAGFAAWKAKTADVNLHSYTKWFAADPESVSRFRRFRADPAAGGSSATGEMSTTAVVAYLMAHQDEIGYPIDSFSSSR